ncbi:MAG: hypothetical protein ACD_58C00021G0002 [uncultured bacterium]|nr:MAG: hypothetical protein ACD_58C00021G0002 [uncultured bacterium]
MKIISWNVNGIRAVVKKGFLDFVKKENPDILCLQEIKTHKITQNIADELHTLNYTEYWNFAKKPGYSGTTIFVKLTSTTPGVKEVSTPGVNRVICGIGDEKFDNEGRVLTLEFNNFYLINAYFPHTRRDLLRLDYKMEFNEKFLEFINNLCHSGDVKEARINSEERFRTSRNDIPIMKQCNNVVMKPIIICGDLNVAHQEIDLANPKENQKNAGFLPQERAWMDKLLASGYIDTCREFTKEGGHYTWWSHFANSRAHNIGWRIDYFIVSNNLQSKLKSSTILPQVIGSDHAPIELNIEL